jgi:hypothetical protein
VIGVEFHADSAQSSRHTPNRRDLLLVYVASGDHNLVVRYSIQLTQLGNRLGRENGRQRRSGRGQ